MSYFEYIYQDPTGLDFPVRGNNLMEAMSNAAIYPFGELLARDDKNNKEYVVAKREEGYRWKATPESANVLEL